MGLALKLDPTPEALTKIHEALMESIFNTETSDSFLDSLAREAWVLAPAAMFGEKLRKCCPQAY